MSVTASVVSYFCVGTDSCFVLLLFLLLEEASTSTCPTGMDEVEVAQCLLHTEKSFSSPTSDWEVARNELCLFLKVLYTHGPQSFWHKRWI